MITAYETIYVISNIVGSYTIYKLMRIFFNELRTNKNIEFFSYLGYYIASSTVFFIIRIPIVMMVVNVFLFFALTFNYSAAIKRKIMFSFLGYMLLMGIEVLITTLTSKFMIPVFGYSGYSSEIGMVLIRVTSLFVVTILTNFKNIKNDIPVPNFYWGSTIFISVSSLFELIVLFTSPNFSKYKVIALLITILGSNFIVLFLYDNLYRSFSLETERLLLVQQNRIYRKQLEIMQQSTKSTQLIRHDIKNHMITLKNLHNNRMDSVNEYIEKIISSVSDGKLYSNSGNLIIDSILNFKLQSIRDMDIKYDIEINIPQEIKISEFDMTVILGNLVDNAITALKECINEKKFIIKMRYSKDNIIITIINSFEGEIKEKDGLLETIKSDKNNHGFGLKSVVEIINKNNGYMDIEYKDNIFKVIAAIPV